MTIRPVMFAAPLLLVAAMSSQVVVASGGEKDPVQKPECPKGQVWDSKTQKCVLQTSSLLPGADRTIYAYRLADGNAVEIAVHRLVP
ncbi:hypothetical protein [Pseudomonas moraviensis]|uniref:hypothetical protein n=1 Tax=Pseudomonas moraviensis TaxID=321662 RepID=UPI0022BF90B1|nr:hypothetical protein [Pseudomonas moraviensis]GLH36454.1 hypothetical protein RS1P1_07370 [Pseudomonas moraviensis]